MLPNEAIPYIKAWNIQVRYHRKTDNVMEVCICVKINPCPAEPRYTLPLQTV